MQLPPTRDILEVFQRTVLPASGGAVLVMVVFLAFGRRVTALGSALAACFAFLWGNFTLANLKPTDEPTWDNTTRLVPWSPDTGDPGWHWLARAGLVLVTMGLVSRWLGLLASRYLPENRKWVASIAVWTPRIAGVVLVSGWVCSGHAAAAMQWLWPTVAALMLVIWVPLDGIARRDSGAEIAAYLYAIFLTGGLVLLYAHSLRFTELMSVMASAMFGIAIVASVSRADVSGAIPACVVLLPGLMIAAGPSLADNEVPALSFWLVALTPLLLTPYLLPSLSQLNGWRSRLIRAGLLLVPLLTAVLLAAHHEKLVF